MNPRCKVPGLCTDYPWNAEMVGVDVPRLSLRAGFREELWRWGFGFVILACVIAHLHALTKQSNVTV
jgi:hypothetical protein